MAHNDPGSSAAPQDDTPPRDPGPRGGPEDTGQSGDGAAPATRTRTGRNLPAALGVGLLLGALALVTLFTVKATFLVYMGVAAGTALWELRRALGVRGIRLPLVPVAVGGAAAVALAYWGSERAVVACLALTMLVIFAWRMPAGTAGYLRDVTAGVFALMYVPLMACFVALMLVAPDGPRRTLVFLLLPICCDIGGYFAGILIGRHPMAPAISPKKTWEGFGGSVVACVVAGGIAVPALLHGAIWQGVLTGLAALAAATLGDLAASMAKRDLGIKDWGSLLPGHGGVLDRIDSLLATAPVVWLLLVIFIR